MCRARTSRSNVISSANVAWRNAALAAAFVFLSGCIDDMADDARLKPLERSTFFADGRASRMPVDGTVRRGALLGDAAVRTGKRNGTPVDAIPVDVTATLLQRGRERFEIFCVACHGRVGDGDGYVVRRGFPRPPSYHIERLRGAPAGHFFDVITSGFGRMFGFEGEISVADRWAIVAYVRALQLSQHFPAGRLSAEERSKLAAGKEVD